MDIKLITRAQAGNRKARTAVIESLVAVAKCESSKWRKLERSEANAVALLALIQGVDAALLTFDATRQAGITAYVRKSIRRALGAAHDKRLIVSAPLDIQQQLRRARAGHRIPPRTMKTLGTLPQGQRSLDEPISDCDGDGEARTFKDLLADQIETPEQIVSRKEGRALLRTLLLRDLSPRDALVITLCYGLDNGEPLEQGDVAAQTGLSIATIKSIRQSALKQWRQIPDLHNILRALVSDRPIRARVAAKPLADGAAGRMPKSLEHQRKLSDEQIQTIRARRASGEANRALAKAFNVSPATITRVTKARFKPAA